MKKDFGTIELKGKIMVSDPCYGIDTWCNTVQKVVKGTYRCEAIINEDEKTWTGVKALRISLLGHENDIADTHLSDNIGVDSGTCGIFDYSYFKKHHGSDNADDLWYSDNVMSWVSKDIGKNTDGKGFITTTYYGDGMYELYGAKDDAKGGIVALEIIY